MDEQLSFTAEYARSDRSTCKACKSQIFKETLRIGRLVKSNKVDNPIPLWYHQNCFAKPLVTPNGLTSTSQISGFQSLRPADQDRVERYLKKRLMQRQKQDASKTARKAAATGGGGGGGGLASAGKAPLLAGSGKRPGAPLTASDIAKRVKTDPVSSHKDDKVKSITSAETKKLWKFKDALKAKLSMVQIRQLLEHNKQSRDGGETDLLDRCADGMLYGRLPKCQQCQGDLDFRGAVYKCTGNFSAFAKCPYRIEIEKVVRKPWTIPDDLKNLLSNYTFAPRAVPQAVIDQRFSTDSEYSAAVKAAKRSRNKANNPAGSRFRDVVITLPGSLFESKLPSIIEAQGGKATKVLDPETTHVVVTQDEFKASSDLVVRAKTRGLFVVALSFIKSVLLDGNICKHENELAFFKPAKHHGLIQLGGKAAMEVNASGTKTLKLRGKCAVDPDSGLAETGTVVQDENSVYNAVLTRTDVQSGMNSFYHIQVILKATKTTREYFLWRSWGRIGTGVGDTKLESYGHNKQDALEVFRTQYFDKSGNKWEDRNKFEVMPNKFVPLNLDYGDESTKEVKKEHEEQKFIVDNSLPIDPKVQAFVMMLFDIGLMKRTMLEMHIDLERMPLGKLSQDQIQRGFQVLKELSAIFDKGEDGAESVDERTKVAQIIDCTNRFYTYIPQSFQGAPPMLDNECLIKAKVEMLEALSEIATATTILRQSRDDQKKSNSQQSKVSLYYSRLRTDMRPVDPASETMGLIKSYVTNTHAKTHSGYSLEVADVFSIEGCNSVNMFNEAGHGADQNRMLLWHGSRLTNWPGILSQGLRIAPPEAPTTGYMFGKGVYFADSASKSANYCHASKINPYGVLVLCEVALGTPLECTKAKFIRSLPEGNNSVKALGQSHPDPTKNHTLADGCVVPMGPLTNREEGFQSDLLYNEYIVYDVARIKPRYLVKVAFNWK